MANNQEQFEDNLIPESVKSSVDSSYTIRPVSRDDYHKGYFQCLQSLTWTGDVTASQFCERFDWMRCKGEGWFYDVVIEHEGKIIGNGVLIVERKFIWNLAIVGHIEEVVTREDYQGKGLGKKIIAALTGVAEKVGCCKVLLNCSPENEAFYEKCGYKKAGMEMSHEFASFQKEGPKGK